MKQLQQGRSTPPAVTIILICVNSTISDYSPITVYSPALVSILWEGGWGGGASGGGGGGGGERE